VFIFTPVYLHYLGESAYGLVGLFSAVQAWLQILDAGLSATLARETARYSANHSNASDFRWLVRFINRVFLVTGLGFALVGILLSRWVALHWLKIGPLDPRVAIFAVASIVVTSAIRWRTEPFRSIVTGFEHTVWLNGFNALSATIRYGGSSIILLATGRSVTAFFAYQVVMSIGEAWFIIAKSRSLIPMTTDHDEEVVSKAAALATFAGFSMSVAATSTLWLFASQFDRLILSSILTLKLYGVFSLATLAAAGVSLLGMPVNQALAPRLTALHAEGNHIEFERIYRGGTSLVSVLVTPSCLLLAFFGQQVLWVWTGNALSSAAGGPIIRWYALGNGLVVFSTFTYYLQYAYGDMKLLVRGHLIFVLLLVPAVIFAAYKFGPQGTGIVWFLQNALYLFIWTYIVHRKFLPGLHWKWLARDIGLTGLPGLVILGLAHWAPIPWGYSRWNDLLMLSGLGILSLFACAAMTPAAREAAEAYQKRRTAMK
jgi:O-antigen/teichoic acid export membrane protein